MLVERPRPAIVLGGPGLGKTTLTLAAATDQKVVKRYGERRCIVSMETATSAQAALESISSALGLQPEPNPWSSIETALTGHSSLLILDNLETPWEPQGEQRDTEELLAQLANLVGVTLLASIRGGRPPRRPAWPMRIEAGPLPSPFDRDLLLDIAGSNKAADPRLDQILTALAGIPLAIELFAHQATARNSFEGPWQTWQSQRTAMLQIAGADDRLSSLTVSIAASLHGPRIDDAGKRLFAMMGRLPAGLALQDAEQLVAGGAAQLVETRLALEDGPRLRMLAPIHEQAALEILEAADAGRLCGYFFSLLYEPQRATPELNNIDSSIEESLKWGTSDRHLLRMAKLSHDMSDLSFQSGNLTLADRGYKRTGTIVRKLLSTDPSNSKLLYLYGINLERFAKLLQAWGRIADAEAAFQARYDIIVKLNALEPDNPDWQRDLSVSYNQIGDIQSAYGNHAEALKNYRQSLDIRRNISQDRPQDGQNISDLCASYTRIGDAELALGNDVAALEDYKTSRQLAKDLVRLDGRIPKHNHLLSASCLKLAKLQLDMNNKDEAFANYSEGHAIAEALARTAPTVVEWQEHLSTSHLYLGDAEFSAPNIEAAREYYKSAHAIMSKLTNTDPGRADWQRSLAISCFKLGVLAARTRDSGEVIDRLQAALHLFHSLRDTGCDIPSDADFISMIEQGLSLHRADNS